MSAQGMLTTVLATGLAAAVLKDDNDPEGHDMSAGLFGPNVSAWLRDVAANLAGPPAEPVTRARVMGSVGGRAVLGCLLPDGVAKVGSPLYLQPPKPVAQEPATPPVLMRDLAEVVGSTVPEVCAALLALGRPPRSTNMAVSGEELCAVAKRLAAPQQPAPPAADDAIVSYSRRRGGWFVCEQTALGEYEPIKGPFDTAKEADSAMRQPAAGVPFKPETWPVDADGFEPDLCAECGTPVRYGSRHSDCGVKATQEARQGPNCPKYLR